MLTGDFFLHFNPRNPSLLFSLNFFFSESHLLQTRRSPRVGKGGEKSAKNKRGFFSVRLFSLCTFHHLAWHLLATYKISFISTALFPHDITYCFAYQFSTHFCQTLNTAQFNAVHCKRYSPSAYFLFCFFSGDCYSPTDKYLSLLYVLIEALRFSRCLCTLFDRRKNLKKEKMYRRMLY